MKIQKIRGENVASLKGPFELNLETGVLAEAGVFAIVGPTGAGKSTLFDTACLAIYGKTPRTSDANKDVRIPTGIGGDKLTERNPAHLMSRGSGHLAAEVDFKGIDGKNYRVRWEIQRAHKKPAGAMQNPKRQMMCLDTGEKSSGRKQEMQRSINAVIGC